MDTARCGALEPTLASKSSLRKTAQLPCSISEENHDLTVQLSSNLAQSSICLTVSSRSAGPPNVMPSARIFPVSI